MTAKGSTLRTGVGDAVGSAEASRNRKCTYIRIATTIVLSGIVPQLQEHMHRHPIPLYDHALLMKVELSRELLQVSVCSKRG